MSKLGIVVLKILSNLRNYFSHYLLYEVKKNPAIFSVDIHSSPHQLTFILPYSDSRFGTVVLSDSVLWFFQTRYFGSFRLGIVVSSIGSFYPARSQELV